MIQEKRDFSKKIALLIFRYIIRYVQYFFLVTPVLFSFFVLAFILLMVNPDAFIGVFTFFAYISPVFKTGHLEGDMFTDALMQVFLISSFIFLIIVDLFKLFIKKVFNKTISVSLKQKLIIAASLISVVYLSAFFIGLFSDSIERNIEWLWVLITFYIINLVSVLIVLLVNPVLNTIAGAIDPEAKQVENKNSKKTKN